MYQSNYFAFICIELNLMAIIDNKGQVNIHRAIDCREG